MAQALLAAAAPGCYLWLEQQAGLLNEGRLSELDVANLLDEIESMGRKDKKAIQSNLVVALAHLLKYQFPPEQRAALAS